MGLPLTPFPPVQNQKSKSLVTSRAKSSHQQLRALRVLRGVFNISFNQEFERNRQADQSRPKKEPFARD